MPETIPMMLADQLGRELALEVMPPAAATSWEWATQSEMPLWQPSLRQ